MRIAVLVKEVPDTYGDRLLDLETGMANKADSELVLDEITERALEVALAYKDDNADTEVELIAMAPESATATIRRGLAMGTDSAVHIADEELAGADLKLTAQTLAAALKRKEYDLIIAGNKSTDGSGGMMAAMLAEHLGLPHATQLGEVSIETEKVSGARSIEGGVQDVDAALPAVISITEALPDPRFPNFKGIMAAKKKPVEVLSAADLDVSVDPAAAASSIMLSVAEKPPRETGTIITDEGDAGKQLATFLIENRLA